MSEFLSSSNETQLRSSCKIKHTLKSSQEKVQKTIKMEPGQSSRERRDISEQYRSSGVGTLFIADEALKRRERGYNERGSNGLWKCDMPGCAVVFDRLSAKENHWRRVHRRERRFECGYSGCDERYFAEAELKRHEDSVHKTGTGYSCPDCDKSYTRKWDLSRHMKKKHEQGSRNTSTTQRRS